MSKGDAFMIGVVVGALACCLMIALAYGIAGHPRDLGVRDHATGKAQYTEVTLPNGKVKWFVTRSEE